MGKQIIMVNILIIAIAVMALLILMKVKQNERRIDKLWKMTTNGNIMVGDSQAPDYICDICICADERQICMERMERE